MNGMLKQAFMSIRVPSERWKDAGQLEELLGLLEKNRNMADSLALFTCFTHSPPPLPAMLELGELLRVRIPEIKQRGFGCGINVLTTIGHHNENLPNSLQGNYTRRTDLDGNVCEGVFCPNDGRFVAEYVVPVYKVMAASDPDYIWVDDDVRSGHMPLREDCFCDFCLERFAGAAGARYDRESLSHAFASGTAAQKLKIRKQWLQAKRDTVNRLLATIEQTVHEVNPAIALGFMTGERYSDGYDFDTQANLLKGPSDGKVMWRPGGGFYRDDRPKEMAGKAHEIGRQVALIQPLVTEIQSEIENFNYEALGKSIHVNLAETAVYIAAGCTGAAYNLINLYEDIVSEKGALFAALADKRPFYDELVSAQQTEPPLGIYTGWNKDSEAAGALVGDGLRWPAGARVEPSFANELFEIGLPAAYRPDAAGIIFLKGEAPYAFSKEELLGWLSKGVYADGPAIQALNELGFAEYTGFVVEGYHDVDCVERLTADEVNGAESGRRRDCRQSFWKCPCASFAVTGEGARTLAEAIDYSDTVKAACSMGIFDNSLGGRVCASGYYPWNFALGSHKAAQMKSLMLWLSKNTLPAYVSTHHKVNLWVRKNSAGKPVVTMLNQSLDNASGLRIRLKDYFGKLTVTDMNLQKTAVCPCQTENGYTEYRIPDISPLSVCLVSAD